MNTIEWRLAEDHEIVHGNIVVKNAVNGELYVLVEQIPAGEGYSYDSLVTERG